MMRNYNLGFISDSDFYKHVKETVEQYRFDIDLASFNKNYIDPIKLTFDQKIYGKGIEAVIDSEIARQLDKSNNNLIGYFHQNIFRYIGEGWTVPDQGFDIVNLDKKYYVEMKNKHNTMNSSAAQKTYMRMQNTLINDESSVCMLVEVISKTSQNKAWRVSLDGTPFSQPSIRRLSIDKFYELVTGDNHAFKKLCEQLVNAIEDVIDTIHCGASSNTVIDELKQLSPNILKSLYLLSFRQYLGFNSFDI